MTKSKVLVAQGGGPTAVINESLVGTILTSREFEDTEAVYGAFHGVRGIVNEDFIDLTGASVENLENVAKTPCSALGSTRDKPNMKYCQEIFKVLRTHAIGTFFYIGGNDSSDTLRILSAQANMLGPEGRRAWLRRALDGVGAPRRGHRGGEAARVGHEHRDVRRLQAVHTEGVANGRSAHRRAASAVA